MSGLVDSPGDIGVNGHACWGYDDLAGDFRDAEVAFLTEGLELGQALMFVGGPEAEEVVRSVEPMSSLVADGLLTIAPFEGDGLPVEKVLDLGELNFIEHTGVHALHEYAEEVRAQGFGVTVRGGPPTLQRLADLLGVSL